MTHQRNTAGLKQSAEERSRAARQRAEEGIRQLLAAKRPVTFKAVHEISGVSSAWLYRHMSERIMHLREQTTGARRPSPQSRASDASKEAIIATLRDRVKKLEAENGELRRQLEVVYGQLSQRR